MAFFDSLQSQPPPLGTFCSFYLKHKKRFCKMRAKEDARFCGEHRLFEDSIGRIPCPFDDKQYSYICMLCILIFVAQ